MRLLQAWIAFEEQRFEDALRLSLAEREQAEAEDWANARQMSLLFGGASALALGRIAEAADDLERLRDWYAHERVLMDWFWESHLAYASCRALAAARRSRARDAGSDRRA